MSSELLSKIRTTIIASISGAVIGLLVAPALYLLIDVVYAWLFLAGYFTEFDRLLVVAISFAFQGAIVGFAVGGGMALIGARTKSALEWPLIVGGGSILGFLTCPVFGGSFLEVLNWEFFLEVLGWKFLLDISLFLSLFLGVVPAVTSWLVVLTIRRVMGTRLARGRFTLWSVVVYLIIAAAAAGASSFIRLAYLALGGN